MKTLPAITLCVLLGGSSVAANAATAPSATAPATAVSKIHDPVAIATAVLNDMDYGRFDAVYARFAPQMAAAVDAAKLKAIWTQLPMQFGKFANRGKPQVETDHDITVVVIPMIFERGSLQASIAIDADGKVAGFWIKPAPPPPAVARSDLPSREVSFAPAGRSALPGTLLLPPPLPSPAAAGEGNWSAREKTAGPVSAGKGPYPAVVFVHGSGPNDRDEAIGGTRVFADLANGLAEAGIASLRYDKRTKAHPDEFTGAFTVDDETTDDALAAVAFLRTQPDIDPQRIYIVGHSQGAMMAPRIAQKAGAQVKGIVLLAAPARHLEDILVDQNEYLAHLAGPISAATQAQLDQLKAAVAAVKTIDGKTPPTQKFLLDLPASYWLSLQDYDDVAVVEKIKQPLLIEQGLRDFQVTAPDWKRWRNAFGHDPRATFHDYPALNHLFVAGSGPSSMAEYTNAGHVDAQVVSDIAAWIKAH